MFNIKTEIPPSQHYYYEEDYKDNIDLIIKNANRELYL